MFMTTVGDTANTQYDKVTVYRRETEAMTSWLMGSAVERRKVSEQKGRYGHVLPTAIMPFLQYGATQSHPLFPSGFL